MAKTIENLFQYLHLTSNVVVLLFFLFVKNSKKEKGLIAIAIYCLCDFLINYFSFILPILPKNSLLYIGAFFTFFEYSTFTFFLWFNLRNRTFKKFILISTITFLIGATFYNIKTNFLYMDSVPIGIETILILIFSFYYLYEQMNDTETLFIYTKYQFWMVIGFMIYLAGSFFVFIYASKVGHDFIKQYWFLTNVFYILMNTFFVIGILVNKKKKIVKPLLNPYLN